MLTSILKRGAITAVALAALSTAAFAQLNELKIMAPAAPGGGWDGTARSMQQALTGAGIVKSVQVNNVTGAGGTIGLSQLIGAKGQGDQLMVNGFVMVGAILLNKSPVNLTQITPIARLTAEAEVIVVPTESPLKTAKDLAEKLKADPAKVTWAGGSAGGTDHIIAALFAQAVGADAKKINYIPFSGGGEALAAMLGGRVTAGVSGYGEFESQIKAGQLRMIGISSEERAADIDAPTFKEGGVDVAIQNWRMIAAAPGISDEQKAAIGADIEKMVKSKSWQDALSAKGWADTYLAGDDFKAQLAEDVSSTTSILKDVGLIK